MLQHGGALKSVSASVRSRLSSSVRFARFEPSSQRQRRANPAKPQHLRVPPPIHLSSRLVSDSEPVLYHREIDVILRDGNKREKRYLRREGWWIPTCVQGAGKFPDLLLSVPILPISQDLQSGLFARQKLGKIKWSGPLYQLRLLPDPQADNQDLPLPFDRIRVKPQNMNVHPITDLPRTIAFLYCPEEKPVRVRLPIHPINEAKCQGLKEGGWLNEIVSAIDVAVAPFTKPPLYATVDVGDMRLKDKKTVADLHFDGKHNGCRTIIPDDTVITVISKV